MNEVERIYQLREELHQHNHRYYVLNAPEIDDQTFDFLMRELQDLEAKHPECQDENSPTMRVGSDLNKNFVQVVHKYPMLSLAIHIRKPKWPSFTTGSRSRSMRISRFVAR